MLLAPLRSSAALPAALRGSLHRIAAMSPEEARLFYRDARSAAPSERRVMMAFALYLVLDFELQEAAQILDSLLESDPADAWTRALRDRVHGRIDNLGPPRRIERAGIGVRWFGDTPTEAQARALADVADGLRREAATALRGSPCPQLEIVVYPTAASFRAATCKANWAIGGFDGAFIHLVARPRLPAGTDVQVLRHESMHAQIASMAPGAPIWLHEGLAEGFSATPQRMASLRRSRELMVKNRTCIPFSSLQEPLREFDGNDADLSYAQSVAMVEFMLDRGGPAAAERALSHLARGGHPSKILAEAIGRSSVTEDDFLDWLVASRPAPAAGR